MTRPSYWMGAFVGACTMSMLIVVFFLGATFLGMPIAPFDLFDWIARTLPGPLITFGIDAMVDTLRFLKISVADNAKTAEHLMALLIMVVLGTPVSAIYFWVLNGERESVRPWTGIIAGLVPGFPMMFISMSINAAQDSGPAPIFGGLWTLALFAGWGYVQGLFYEQVGSLVPQAVRNTVEAEELLSIEQRSRRDFLLKMGGATAMITVVGAGLDVGAKVLMSQPQAITTTDTEEDAVAQEPELPEELPNVDDPVEPVTGTRPEYTPLDDHYNIDINSRPEQVDGNKWRLSVKGLVNTSLMLSLSDLRENYTEVNEFVTLSCISNRVGGSLISTTKWTGVRLAEVLESAGVIEGATHIEIRGRDGFHESMRLDLLDQDERIMLAYAWDDEPLRPKHGFPLRIWIPDRFGMKQPKWIESIEVVNEDRPGYWVTRGWDQHALVRSTSVIDTVGTPIDTEDRGMIVPIGGIAYAGARGVSVVQVQVNDGPWEECQLRTPLGEATWVIWRYEWPFEAGTHTFRVRMAEGNATPQIEIPAQPRPSGATGYHSVRATVEAET